MLCVGENARCDVGLIEHSAEQEFEIPKVKPFGSMRKDRCGHRVEWKCGRAGPGIHM